MSEVVGAILALVVLLLLLSLYQVYGIPSQINEIEFKHSQETRGDMLDLRNAILDAQTTGRTKSATVGLAPQYPARVLGINPPTPTGTLSTTENETVEVHDGTGDPVEACPVTDATRMVEYEASYNEYDGNPTMRYENTVVYADYEDTARPISGQRLVEGNSVNIVVVQPEYTESGSGVASFDPRPGRVRQTDVESPTVSVPTRLDETGWLELLDGEVDAENVEVDDDELILELEDTYTVSCGVVGTRGAPPGGDRATEETEEGDAGDIEINPADPGEIKLIDSEILGPGGGFPFVPPGQQDRRDVRLTFENTGGEDATVTEARIAFYYQSPQPARWEITEANLYDSPTPPLNFRANLGVSDETVELSQPVTFAAESQDDISMRFNVRPVENDFFVVKLVFEDGETGLYFVGM